MRFRIVSSVLVTYLVAVSLVSAQDASDTATSQYEALKLHTCAQVRPLARRSADPFARVLQPGALGQAIMVWWNGPLHSG